MKILVMTKLTLVANDIATHSSKPLLTGRVSHGLPSVLFLSCADRLNPSLLLPCFRWSGQTASVLAVGCNFVKPCTAPRNLTSTCWSATTIPRECILTKGCFDSVLALSHLFTVTFNPSQRRKILPQALPLLSGSQWKPMPRKPFVVIFLQQQREEDLINSAQVRDTGLLSSICGTAMDRVSLGMS